MDEVEEGVRGWEGQEKSAKMREGLSEDWIEIEVCLRVNRCKDEFRKALNLGLEKNLGWRSWV